MIRFDGDVHACGMIPRFLDAEDLRPAREQLNENYAHGGGWRPMKGFTHLGGGRLRYSGDPVYVPLASAQLRDELIVVYPSGWVAIFQPGSMQPPGPAFEVARLD